MGLTGLSLFGVEAPHLAAECRAALSGALPSMSHHEQCGADSKANGTPGQPVEVGEIRGVQGANRPSPSPDPARRPLASRTCDGRGVCIIRYVRPSSSQL